MKKKNETKPTNSPTKKRRTRRRINYTALEKCRAVLALWTERRTMTELCKELSVNWTQLDTWQNKALEGMLIALEARRKEERQPALNSRLQKLLEKRKPAASARKPEVTLETRLKSLCNETDSP